MFLGLGLFRYNNYKVCFVMYNFLGFVFCGMLLVGARVRVGGCV